MAVTRARYRIVSLPECAVSRQVHMAAIANNRRVNYELKSGLRSAPSGS
jgi:hypothetical protein